MRNAKSAVSTLALLAVVFTMVFISSCSDDDEGDNGPDVVGSYQIQSAVLLEATEYPVPPPVGTILPAESQVAPIFNSLVATAGPCGADPSQTAIELTSNGKMIYACLDNSSLSEESGTWLLSGDGKTLSIIIVSENLGPTPVTVTINVSDFELTETTLSGTISEFPFFPGEREPDTAPQVQTVSMDVIFTRL